MWCNPLYIVYFKEITTFLKKIEKNFKILKKVKIQGKWRE